MKYFAALLVSLTLLANCSPSGKDLSGPLEPFGEFKLGHNVVVASKAQRGPLSRKATEDELVGALKDALGARFGRYEGSKFYHLGVSVEGYVLAAPGVPLVYSPKSIMIINVTVWDDAAGKKLNEKPEQITVFESLTGENVIGSGLTQSKEEQLENLSVNAGKQIELFMARMRDEQGWFGETPAAAEG